MPPPSESFRSQLRRLRQSQPDPSLRKLATLAGVEYSLISKVENGQRPAGPVTVEKLANALKLVGNARDEFIRAGLEQSKRANQAFGSTMANPFFRSIFHDLLQTLDIRGEILSYEAQTPLNGLRYDVLVTLVDGPTYAIEFKRRKIFVVPVDPAGAPLPAHEDAAVLAAGGFVVDLKFRGNHPRQK